MSQYIYEVYDKIVCICVSYDKRSFLHIQRKLHSREVTP